VKACEVVWIPLVIPKAPMNRPGVSGDFEPWEGWSHAREQHQEVPA
jgi:hypothetical protein